MGISSERGRGIFGLPSRDRDDRPLEPSRDDELLSRLLWPLPVGVLFDERRLCCAADSDLHGKKGKTKIINPNNVEMKKV